MSQREHETEFLRQMLVREDSTDRQHLQSQLDESEQRLRCIRRTFWLVAFLMALSAAGVGYGVIFLPGIVERRPHFLLQFFFTVLTGCLISLMIYSVTWLWQSHLASRLRKRCRQFLLDRQAAGDDQAATFFPALDYRGRLGGIATTSSSLASAGGRALSRKAP